MVVQPRSSETDQGWLLDCGWLLGSSSAALGGASLQDVNVALVRAPDSEGICGPEACLVPLSAEVAQGWTAASGRILLPPAVCDRLEDGDISAVAVTTACETKTRNIPPCGPWSSVGTQPGDFDAGAPVDLEGGGGEPFAGAGGSSSGVGGAVFAGAAGVPTAGAAGEPATTSWGGVAGETGGGGGGSSGGSQVLDGGVPTGDGGSPSSGGAAGSGLVFDGGVVSGGATGDAAPAAGGSSCVAVTQATGLVPVNLVFVVDKSGSMGDDPGDPPAYQNYDLRWVPVSEGLLAFFNDPGSTSLYASLEFFPANGGIEIACDPAQYGPTSVVLALTSLEDTTPFIIALESTEPSGGTPTWPAVRGSLDYALALQTEDPDSQSIVVLVTDGEPGLAAPPYGTRASWLLAGSERSPPTALKSGV